MNKKIGYEEAISLLEDKVRALESGNMTLDESIAAFEEAIALVKVCNKKLEATEARVRILTEGNDGEITDMPFDVANEN